MLLTFDRHRFIVSVIVAQCSGVACTDIMDAPFVGVETARLVLEHRLEEELAEEGVGPQEDGPRGEDDVGGVDVAVRGDLWGKALRDVDRSKW